MIELTPDGLRSTTNMNGEFERGFTLPGSARPPRGSTAGAIDDKDHDHMEKIVELKELLANCVMLYNGRRADGRAQGAAEGHSLRSQRPAPPLHLVSRRHILSSATTPRPD